VSWFAVEQELMEQDLVGFDRLECQCVHTVGYKPMYTMVDAHKLRAVCRRGGIQQCRLGSVSGICVPIM
jgi:hypothetical protein